MPGTETVLVTGATGNIGGAAALALARQGRSVALLGRHAERLKRRAATIRAILDKEGVRVAPGALTTLEVDFTDQTAVRNAAAEALDRFERIDALILSVGRLVQDGPHVLPDGHEVMFATSVVGPHLFTRMLLDRLRESEAMLLQVAAPFYRELDWDDIESVEHHKTVVAYNRAKTCERALAAEWARRYANRLTTVIFDPTFVIDRHAPELKQRWPHGFMGWVWRIYTLLFARPPRIAGEALADLIVNQNRHTLNGAHYRLDKRMHKPDRAVRNTEMGARLWKELEMMAPVKQNERPSSSPDVEIVPRSRRNT